MYATFVQWAKDHGATIEDDINWTWAKGFPDKETAEKFIRAFPDMETRGVYRDHPFLTTYSVWFR